MEVHMVTLPIAIGADLVIRIGREAAQLSPSQGFRVAEQLLQHSIQRMVVDAALRNEALKRPVSRRKPH
jgi:hypothetical protein